MKLLIHQIIENQNTESNHSISCLIVFMGFVADSSPDSMSSDDCTDTPLFGRILFDGVPKEELSRSLSVVPLKLICINL